MIPGIFAHKHGSNASPSPHPGSGHVVVCEYACPKYSLRGGHLLSAHTRHYDGDKVLVCKYHGRFAEKPCEYSSALGHVISGPENICRFSAELIECHHHKTTHIRGRPALPRPSRDEPYSAPNYMRNRDVLGKVHRAG